MDYIYSDDSYSSNGTEEYYRILANIAFYLMTASSSLAGTLTFQKEQKCNIIELNELSQFRKSALHKFQEMISSELCSFLRLEPAIKQLGMAPEEFMDFSEKVLQREILEERLDGQTYYLKARIFADHEAITTAADLVKEIEQKVRELELAKRKAEEALREVERLEQEVKLAKVKVDIFRKPTAEDDSAYKSRARLFNKAKDLLQKSLVDKAVEIFSELIQKYPGDSIGYIGRGSAYFKKGEYELAEKDFSKAIEVDPNIPEAYNNRASSLVMQGKFEESLGDYGEAIRLDPKYWDAFKNRGIVYLKYTQDYEAALKDFQYLVDNHPNDYKAYLLKGIANAKLGRFEDAVNDYDKAISLKQIDATVFFNKGNALLRNYQCDRAIENYNRAIELRDDIASFYHNRGFAFAKKGMLLDAIFDFDRAIELEPGEPTAYIIRGFLHWKLGEKQRALEDWEKAGELGDTRGIDYAGSKGIV